MQFEDVEHLLRMAGDAIERAQGQGANVLYARIEIAKAIDWLTRATAELGLKKHDEESNQEWPP